MSTQYISTPTPAQLRSRHSQSVVLALLLLEYGVGYDLAVEMSDEQWSQVAGLAKIPCINTELIGMTLGTLRAAKMGKKEFQKRLSELVERARNHDGDSGPAPYKTAPKSRKRGGSK